MIPRKTLLTGGNEQKIRLRGERQQQAFFKAIQRGAVRFFRAVEAQRDFPPR